MYEKHAKKINKIIKSRKVVNGRNSMKVKKNNSRYRGARYSMDDDDAPLKNYFLNLIHTKEDLQQIDHCFNPNKIYTDPCDDCRLKLAEIEAQQYARSNAAFEEHKKISADATLSRSEKKIALRELVNGQDDYKLIRKRLEMIQEKRGEFDQIPEVVQYNRNWNKWLVKAFNDLRIQRCVELNRPKLGKLGFGIYCSKLMDDVVNAFFVQVTVTCMNFAYQEGKVMLTKEILVRYQAFFKMTNRDASYLEPYTQEMRALLTNEYERFLPSSEIMKILITDTLFRQCFSDDDLIHASLDSLIFEHFKSPQPIFKFLMYMKFTKDYLVEMKILLLRFLFQIAVEVLKLKKRSVTNNLVTYSELIEACEIVGVFGSSYTNYLKHAYQQYQENTMADLQNQGYVLGVDGTFIKEKNIQKSR